MPAGPSPPGPKLPGTTVPGKFKLKLPPSVRRESAPYKISDEGQWLILSDSHVPFHEEVVIEQAVLKARRRGVKGVLLNGDTLDFHELSRFDQTPDDPRYIDEIRLGRDFLAYLRERFPRARVVWKDGNHEERLRSYLINKAKALFGLDVLSIPKLLDFERHGVEYVTDRRVIHLGKLNVVHGHEYKPNIQAPVNPARGLFLRAKSVAVTSHFHQTSEHHEPNINGKPQGAWSVGCSCQLKPLYMPLNKWNHGFAFVEISSGGEFSVDNRRVLDGTVV